MLEKSGGISYERLVTEAAINFRISPILFSRITFFCPFGPCSFIFEMIKPKILLSYSILFRSRNANTASNYTETDDIITCNIKNWLLACTKINFTRKGIFQKKNFAQKLWMTTFSIGDHCICKSWDDGCGLGGGNWFRLLHHCVF